jgi:hypothetical protein
MKRLLPILFLILVMSACAPDPRREAEAYQIKSQADQDALNQSQQRQHSEDVHAVEIQALQVQQTIRAEELRVEQELREATAREMQNGTNRMIKYGFIFGTFALCTLFVSVSYGFVGVARAQVRAAEVKANLIPLDSVTRQFPALLQYVGKGKYSLTNLNVNGTLMLDTRNDADRQMIATAGATQIAGVIASEAAKSNDAAGVAIIRPTVINARDETVEVGDSWRQDA